MAHEKWEVLNYVMTTDEGVGLQEMRLGMWDATEMLVSLNLVL